MRGYAWLGAAVAASALLLSACGGPADPSAAVVLRGTVVGQAAAAPSASAAGEGVARSSAARITVTVQESPSLTTTVSGNGTFELSGLPEGGFTLVFTSNGVRLGTIAISGFDAGQEIRITVDVTGNTVVLVSIENGNGGDGDADDDDGEDEDDGDDDDGGETRACLINGGKVGQNIELEGNVNGTPGAAFRLKVNGNRARSLVDVNAAGASWKCNGKPDGPCNATALKDGSKVHVSGTLNTCTMDSAMVTASRVMIQK
jgi:hypothetical protein